MSEIEPYNPLDKLNLARSIADALLNRPALQIDDVSQVSGAGVYVIYYRGNYGPYTSISQKNTPDFGQPIYVGKAIPKGGRKGGLSMDSSQGVALRDRISQHASSVDQAENLNMGDFYYRCLVIDDIWIPLGENILIEKYKPLWNLVVDGFGNKDPGQRRAAQNKSPWDAIHPGREFSKKLSDCKKTPEEIKALIEAFLQPK